MADLKLGNIKPVGADNVVVESKYVKGSYVVVANITERDSLKGEAGENIVVGSLCYCQADSTFYQYNGTDWVESLSFVGYATEGYVDEEVKNELDKLAETIPSIEGLASEEFVADAIKNKVDDTTLENYYTKTEADEEFMTQSEVDSRVNEIISKASNTDTIKDLTSLVDYLDSHGTEASEMAAAITELETNKADKTEIPDLAGYATEGYVDEEVKNELAKLSIPSIDGLATEEYVDEKIKDIDAIVGDLNVTYTNETPIVNALGSIKVGQTFENVTIQEMLTMILYPYIDIEVGTTATTTAPTGSYYTHNLPTLSTATIYVKKNSATNLAFSLWDTTNNKQLGNTLTEADINKSNNTISFTNLNTLIETTRTFKIKYTYNGDEGKPQTEKTVTVGTFTISFQNPSTPTITSNLGDSLSYYNGQTASVTEITANIASLNSASSISKIELYKNNTKVGNTVSNPTLPYKFTVSDSNTSTTTYKVKVYFNKRDGNSTTLYESSLENSFAISFSHRDATISLSGISGGTFSKLNAQTISANKLTASFYKYSDKITSVKLFEGSTEKETQSVSGFDGDAYSTTKGTQAFSYSKSDICSNISLTAKAYNGNTVVATTSSSINFNFYAPYCYGFVDPNVTFDSISRSTLEGLTNKLQSAPSTITLAEPNTQQKVVYAVPGGTYAKIKDLNTGMDATGSFTKGTKTITFVDGSTQNYQIFILTDKVKAAMNLEFSK